MPVPGRTTASLVRAIIDTDLTVSMDPYIDAANTLVTRKCAAVTVPASDPAVLYYDTAQLTLIETWLAAHFYCVFDPRNVKVHVGSISETLQGKVDLGLDNSLYGQMAMRLDSYGALAAMNNAMKEQESILPGARGSIAGTVIWLGRRCPLPVN